MLERNFGGHLVGSPVLKARVAGIRLLTVPYSQPLSISRTGDSTVGKLCHPAL